MNYIEYGEEKSHVIVLLHGGGLSVWNYKEVAEILQTDYHVIIPILDGHAGSDKKFTTIENNAKSDMIAFLQANALYYLKDSIEECETLVQIFVGEKESHAMKKSAKLIHEKLQDSFIKVLPDMYHGEFSINHADDYVRKLLELIKQRIRIYGGNKG